jgi:hypothetical protein
LNLPNFVEESKCNSLVPTVTHISWICAKLCRKYEKRIKKDEEGITIQKKILYTLPTLQIQKLLELYVQNKILYIKNFVVFYQQY